MILCIDAGNTRLKFGLHNGQKWLAYEALPNTANQDEINALLTGLPVPPTRIVACNVAGTAVREQLDSLATARGMSIEWLHSSEKALGVRNSYDSPAQLGNDRWAALIGARHLCPSRCIVVMAGTATTIDALDDKGQFLGGLILPGLELMRKSLARDTAQLPLAQGHYQAWPRNTDDAIASGALVATSAAVAQMRAQLTTDNEPDTVPCLLSGGAAYALRSLIKPPLIWQPELALEGLAHVASSYANSSTDPR